MNWLIEFTSSRLVPTPSICPNFENMNVILGDTHFAIVDGDYNEISAEVNQFPYWRIAGQPADGKWVDGGGAVLYFLNGQSVDEHKLWQGMGYKPSDFGATSWDDVDESLVYDQIPVH